VRVVTAVRARVAIGAALLAAALAGPARAVPLTDYHDRVAEAMRVVASAYDAEEGPTVPAALARVRELLPPSESVEFDGRTVAVDNAWVGDGVARYEGAADAEARSAALDAVAARLYAIDLHLDRLDESPAHATEDEHAKLREVLARSEFQPPAESSFARWVRDTRRRVLEFLSDLIERLFGGSRGQSVGTLVRVVTIAVGALALLLLLRALATAFARRGAGGKREKRAKKAKTKTVLGEEVDASSTSDDIARAARALAASGDLRGAVRKLFVALIYRLDERGLVFLHAEATNREYLALVRELGRLHPVMASMTDVFERVWYGEASLDRAGYDEFERMYTRACEIVDQQVVVH
jgi:hypothetical protein